MTSQRLTVQCLVAVAALAASACSKDAQVGADAAADARLDRDLAADVASPPDVAAPDGGPRDGRPPADVVRPPARWDLVGPMSTARTLHVAVALPGDKVLVAGGLDGAVLSSAELFDLASGTWSAAGEMGGPLWFAVGGRLGDGRVIVASGCHAAPSNTCMVDGLSVFVFDPGVPAADRWQVGPAMSVARQSACGTVLADGRLLVAGGYDNLADHKSLEIYDPKLAAWISPAASLSEERSLASATLLASGKVLIAGGSGVAGYTDTLDLFDPQAGTVKALAARLAGPRGGHAAVLLADGRVLFVGGECRVVASDPCEVSAVEIYDPVSDQVQGAGSHHSGAGVRATRLADGRVLVTGGTLTPTAARIFDPAGNVWQPTAALHEERVWHTATLVGEKVVVAGGRGAHEYDGRPSVEVFTP